MNITMEPVAPHVVAHDTFLTWSPDPKHHRGIVKPRDQFLTYDWVINLLAKSCTGILSPELNKNGNIHYHAVLTIQDPAKWYTHTLPAMKKVGFTCVKQITNTYDKVYNYVLKEAKLNQKIFKIKLPIPIVLGQKVTAQFRIVPVHKLTCPQTNSDGTDSAEGQ